MLYIGFYIIAEININKKHFNNILITFRNIHIYFNFNVIDYIFKAHIIHGILFLYFFFKKIKNLKEFFLEYIIKFLIIIIFLIINLMKF